MAYQKKRPEGLLTFGSMPFDVEQVVGAFTDPESLIKQMAHEMGLTLDQARVEYARLTTAGASARLLSTVVGVLEETQAILSREKVVATEARAREIVLAYARGEKYQGAKELVLAAASYVKAQEMLRALASSPLQPASWLIVHTAFELALWIAAGGVHNQIEVARGTRKATQVRQDAARSRVEKLAAAIKGGAAIRGAADVLAWRKEKKTDTSYERARRDLHAARLSLGSSAQPSSAPTSRAKRGRGPTRSA